MRKTIISIIVPVYNAEKFIHVCLDSIIEQTFKDFEVVIVDDGSNDNSGAICDEYCNKDKRFKVYHRENHGVSATRNYALGKCHGDYICFLDSDDYIHSMMLEILYDNIIKSGVQISSILEKDVYDYDIKKIHEEITYNEDKSYRITTKELLKGIVQSHGKEKSVYFHFCLIFFSN